MDIELANNIYKANLVGLVTYDIHNEYEQQLNQKIRISEEDSKSMNMRRSFFMSLPLCTSAAQICI